MISFFRKVRQKLLTDNRFSKYLLYGVGEIFLVVIGILIALQVNNWNEDRKDRVAGSNYLERILSDVKKDTTLLKQKNRMADTLSSGYAGMILQMHKPQRSEDDFVRLMNSVEFNVDELILSDVAYSELLNTGNMDLILNDSLKEQLSDYYRNYSFVASRVRELNQSNLNSLHAASIVAPTLKYWAKGYMKIFPDEISDETESMYSESDWAFINNPRSLEFRLLEDAVYYYYLKQALLKPLYNDLYDQAVALIESIEIEFDTNKSG